MPPPPLPPGPGGPGPGYGPWWWSNNYHPPMVNPFRVFYVLTGVSFFAFFSGFSVCLFDLNQVSQCVDYAEQGVQVLKRMGDHIILWFIKLVQEVLHRYPL